MNTTFDTNTPPPQWSPAGGDERGWHLDPRSEHNLRYHNGVAWTQHCTHHGPTPCQGCHPAQATQR